MALEPVLVAVADLNMNDDTSQANLAGTETVFQSRGHSTQNPHPPSHTTAPGHGSTPPEHGVAGTSGMPTQNPLPSSHTTAPGHGSTPPGHGVAGASGMPLKKKARALVANVSIEERANFERSSKLGQKVLKADNIKSDCLPKLAKEHLEQFKEAFGEEFQRRMAPNREIRVATACTGSGAEVFSLLAVLEAFRDIYPGLQFFTVWLYRALKVARIVGKDQQSVMTDVVAASKKDPVLIN